MAVDLKKHHDSLLKTYNDVVNDSSKINWMVLGYDGHTTALKVVESGDGGIEEMSEELNSGLIQYGYCRVIDPNTSLPKYVLINWQGEGAQDSQKLKCTAHLRDVQAFLKTVHVIVNARTETDIDEDDIVKKVAKASGANYSFHKEKAKAFEAPAPVGTDYHRIVPERDINTKTRDKFWAETEKDEKKRKEEAEKQMAVEKAQADQERKDRELQETRARDKRTDEHIRQVREQKDAEKRANEASKAAESERWEKEQRESAREEEERRQRGEHARKERAAEAEKLASESTTSSARNFFKQKSVERPDADARKAPPPPRKLKTTFAADQQEAAAAPPPPASRGPPPPPANREPAAPAYHEPEPEPEPAYTPQSPSYEPSSPSYEPHSPSYEQEPEPEPVASPTLPQTRNLLAGNLPPRQDDEDEAEDENWDEAPAEDFSPSHYQEEQHHQEPQSPTQHQQEVNGGGGEQGRCARALYDYQASDETEINFDPEDIITNIEMIDDGWWQGFAPDGSYGMFPSNYVELI